MPLINKIANALTAKGALSALAKEAPAAKLLLPTADLLLPVAERDANLAKFLEKSAVKDPVFHAAKTSFTTFSPKQRTELSNMGHHFGTSEQANFRTNQYDFQSKNPNIGKFHLNIQNPLEVTHMGSFAPDHLADQMMDMNLITPEKYEQIVSKHDYNDLEIGSELQKILKKNGYDGLAYPNEREGEGFSYVPFDATQIKSAIGNRGTYDVSDPDFNKAKGGAVHFDKGGSVGSQTNPFFDLADYSAGPPRDAMYSGFVPGTNPMARKAEQQRLMREAKQLTPAAALMRGLGEGYFGDVTTPNAEQGYSVMDPSNRAPAGREAEMQRYRDIGTALGIGADPITMLAPLAKPAVKAIGRGALAAARSDTAYDLANRVASATGASPLYAVKPKGGNWAPPINLDLPSKRLAGSESNANSDSVTRALSPLRTYYQGPNRAPAEIESLNANVAEPLNRWLDKKLAPYVRNEMGTPDDPIRLMHELGYTHSPAIRGMEENLAGTTISQRVDDARSEAGFPEEGFAVRRHAEAGYPEENLLNTRRAEEWETLSDSAIDPNIAGNYQEDIQLGRQRLENRKPEFKSILGDWDPNVEMAEKNPWIEKLDPNTPIYRIADSQTFSSDLDFNHLMDELRASLSPDSELPAHLRLTPEKLNKVSVADAVKRVSEINDWRALQAAKAEQAGMLENLAANSRLADPTAKLSFVEKPGLTWVDVPEVVNEKGTKLCTDIGKAGGWCTMNADTAREYGSGENRLVALLDAEGRPHAQAMIQEPNLSPFDEWFEQNGFDNRAPEVVEFVAWSEAKARSGGLKMNPNQRYLEWAAETGRPIAQPAQSIQELKPPGNSFGSGRSEVYKKRDPDYQKKVSESVVKFLNSGKWGTVNDLDIYGIIDFNRPNDVLYKLKYVLDHMTSKQIAEHSSDVLSNYPARFMTKEQFKEFVESQYPQSSPPAEGYAEGGAVHILPFGGNYAKGGKVSTNPFDHLV
jgi:hypothetical protein